MQLEQQAAEEQQPQPAAASSKQKPRKAISRSKKRQGGPPLASMKAIQSSTLAVSNFTKCSLPATPGGGECSWSSNSWWLKEIFNYKVAAAATGEQFK